MHQVIFRLVVFAIFSFSGVLGHGRLIEPPSRSSMWRYGFNTPPNYDDNGMSCGGYALQWGPNNGKCGLCGDPWNDPLPRAHEAGGRYATGTIVRKYGRGSVIPIKVELTANHLGYFEFRVCPVVQHGVEVTQECLDNNILVSVNGGSKYYTGPRTGIFDIQYRLPGHLTCSHCVLQWKYTAGNNWGQCENGTGAVGCGPQVEFRACADISID